MEHDFARRFTMKEFLAFILPTVVGMIFISLYTIVDGVFVSVFVGSDGLAAVNITFPIFNLGFGIAIMLATGANAVVAKNLGEEKLRLANERFTFVSVLSVVLGIGIAAICLFNLESIVRFLGATDRLFDYGMEYGFFLVVMTPFLFIRTLYEYFIRTDGNANFSLFVSVFGGVLNLILDYVFIVQWNMGVAGAGLATTLGIVGSMILAVGYFIFKSKQLKFCKFKCDWKYIGQSMYNGSSEMVTEFSTGITTLIFNLAVLHYAGEEGVAALTIILYAHFVMVSAYMGFVAATAPLFSYNYGARNQEKLKELMVYSRRFLLVSSLMIFLIAQLSAPVLIGIFTPADTEVFALAQDGLHLFAWSFLFVGINIFASGLFTSLSNGKVSAIISFCRTLLFVVISLLVLTKLFGLTGVWLTVPCAELATLLVSVYYMKTIGVEQQGGKMHSANSEKLGVSNE